MSRRDAALLERTSSIRQKHLGVPKHAASGRPLRDAAGGRPTAGLQRGSALRGRKRGGHGGRHGQVLHLGTGWEASDLPKTTRSKSFIGTQKSVPFMRARRTFSSIPLQNVCSFKRLLRGWTDTNPAEGYLSRWISTGGKKESLTPQK